VSCVHDFLAELDTEFAAVVAFDDVWGFGRVGSSFDDAPVFMFFFALEEAGAIG